MVLVKKNIFVIGLDKLNLSELEQLPHAKEYNFHSLCEKADLKQAEGGSFKKILDMCRGRLKEFEGSIDSIIAYWDFPAEAIAPILRKEYEMPYNTLESLEKCEHKFWSRKAQMKVIPENTPRFQKVNPFDDDAVSKLEIGYPFWLKPVNSFSSYLGFKINNEKEFKENLEITKKAINDIAEPYNELLEKVSLPYDMQEVDGTHCIAEEIIAGEMFATCGYVYRREVNVYGAVDVVRLENNSTLSRLNYPTRLSEKTRQRAVEATNKLMSSIGYDNAAFHVEWMFDEKNDKLWVVEINPRISQSHGELFRLVDSSSDMSIPINIALDRDPAIPYRKGDFKLATKYYIRVKEDAKVESIPSPDDIKKLNEKYPDVVVSIKVKEGQMLSDITVEDSYTYCIGELYLGAESEDELLNKIKECESMLPFKLV